MSACVDGCDRPVLARQMCSRHYQKNRYTLTLKGKWHPRVNAIGIARRLRALVAIGYLQRDLASRLGLDGKKVSLIVNLRNPTIWSSTASRVCELYDILSMTPGTSDFARQQAKAKGWAPPLAWDDDAIDDPDATSSIGVRQSVSFLERYTELRELGYNDLQIVGKLDVKPESLLRQLDRYSIKPSADLVAIASSHKHRKPVAS